MSVYRSLVAAYAPLCSWLLTDAGPTFVDTSGHGYDLSVVGSVNPASVSSPIVGEGNVCGFPGNFGFVTNPPNYLESTSAPALSVVGPYSVEAWIYQNTPFGYGNKFFVWGDGDVELDCGFTNAGSAHPIYFFRQLDDLSGLPTGFCNVQSTSPAYLTPRWQHVVYVVDSAAAPRIYVDAVLMSADSSHVFSDPTTPPTTAKMRVGGEIFVTSGDGGRPWNGAIAAVALYPFALSDCQVRSLHDAAISGAYTPCFDNIRLVHAHASEVCWEHNSQTWRVRSQGDPAEEHDGTIMTVYSDATPVLRTPLPTLGAAPTTVVGKHPDSGLPAFGPMPTPALHGLAPLVPPVPVPTTTPTCNPLRCGAASNMRDHLASLYSQWATVLGPALHLAEVFGVSTAIAALGELAIDSAVLGPFAAPIWAALAPVMATLLTLVIPAPVPPLTPTQSTLIWNGAYCQLTCDGNVVDPTSGQVQAWNTYLTANSGTFSSPSLQLALLNALLDFTPLLDWQTAAATAVANSGCVGFTCP